MYQDDLAKLSRNELIALVQAQTAQIEALTRRVAELEAKLAQPLRGRLATGRLHRQSALQALRFALAGQPILIPP